MRIKSGEPIKREQHRKRYTTEYKTWYHMWQRCTNPKNEKFLIYGARGITVCEEWGRFSVFYEHMGPKPSPKHTIDRINNDGNYEPGNCRWATNKEQCRNTRVNRIITCDGVSMAVAAWADKLGVSQDFLNNRVHRGWTHERIIKEPKHNRGQ